MTDVNPFLGARPYCPSDDAVFFGRAAATAALVERIALRPLTIVSAPSGAGKTSLLRAAVLPELERDGLCVVYMRPDPDVDGDAAAPLLGGRLVRLMTDTLLPDPLAERTCLQKLLDHPELRTLGDAQDWFAGLAPHDRMRESMLRPAEGLVDQLPMLARCLRGTFRPEALGAQLACLGVAPAASMTSRTSLAELREHLDCVDFVLGAAAARSRLLSDAEDPARSIAILRRLAQGASGEPLLVRPDGDPDCMVRILLVIDQFEQLFTLAAPDRRDKALALLQALIDAPLPLSIVLSLRKEWYADLLLHMPHLRRQSEVAGRTTYHLLPMTRDEAVEVMDKVPPQVGAPAIESQQQDELWNGLQQDETIDAVALSIACHELVALNDPTNAAAALSSVDKLLTAYLHRALESLPQEDREEALDMLGEIAGSGATRGFVTHMRLVQAPLRDPARRASVLSNLQRVFLVRGDNPRRGWDKVYDVIHERLLEPLRTYLADRPRVAAFRAASERLAQADESGLDWQNCCALLNGWTRLHLDPRSGALLLCSLIQELTIDRVKEAVGHRGPLQGLFSNEAVAGQTLRSICVDLAKTVSAEVSVDGLSRAAKSWWLRADEVEAQLSRPPDLPTDIHAMISALRAPAGSLREPAHILAKRIAQATAPFGQPAAAAEGSAA